MISRTPRSTPSSPRARAHHPEPSHPESDPPSSPHSDAGAASTTAQRSTTQRNAIKLVFEESTGPLSPREILDAARLRVSGIGIATIYRTIKSLLDSGWLATVELPGQPPRYERAGKGHHHHFHCRACRRVFEIEGCPGSLRKLTPAGFALESHDLTLHGICRECIAAGVKPEPASHAHGHGHGHHSH